MRPILIVALVLSAALTGCAGFKYAHWGTGKPQKDLDEPAARRIVASRLPGVYSEAKKDRVARARVSRSGLRLVMSQGAEESISWDDMDIQWDVPAGGEYRNCEIKLASKQQPVDTLITDGPTVYSVPDALATLRLAERALAAAEKDAQARFEQVARDYRDAASKPEVPEDARRYKIQAESAVKDKQFAAAERYYGQALEIAPWWPEGRYNHALLLAENEDFDAAMAEMKRYLALVPDAPNARQAQDKIYNWER